MSFDRERTPLKLLGYTSGAGAPQLRSQRQRPLKLAFNGDLREILSPEDYDASGAQDWGLPKSKERFQVIFKHLAGWLSTYNNKGYSDAVRHRVLDLFYLIEHFYDESFELHWEAELRSYGVYLPEDVLQPFRLRLLNKGS